MRLYNCKQYTFTSVNISDSTSVFLSKSCQNANQYEFMIGHIHYCNVFICFESRFEATFKQQKKWDSLKKNFFFYCAFVKKKKKKSQQNYQVKCVI